MKLRRILCTLPLLALAACGVNPGGAPPGKCIQYVSCPDGIADCHEQARETCPGGYHQMQDSDVGSDFTEFSRQHNEDARAGAPHIVFTCD